MLSRVSSVPSLVVASATRRFPQQGVPGRVLSYAPQFSGDGPPPYPPAGSILRDLRYVLGVGTVLWTMVSIIGISSGRDRQNNADPIATVERREADAEATVRATMSPDAQATAVMAEVDARATQRVQGAASEVETWQRWNPLLRVFR